MPQFLPAVWTWKEWQVIPELYTDVYDGQVWKDFQSIQSFLSSGNLGLMLRLLLLCDDKLYLRHTPAAKSERKQ